LWNFCANLFVKRTPFFLQNLRAWSHVVYGDDDSHHPACITCSGEESTRAVHTWMLKIHSMNIAINDVTTAHDAPQVEAVVSRTGNLLLEIWC